MHIMSDYIISLLCSLGGVDHVSESLLLPKT